MDLCEHVFMDMSIDYRACAELMYLHMSSAHSCSRRTRYSPLKMLPFLQCEASFYCYLPLSCASMII
jgi:hypothetical protein